MRGYTVAIHSDIWMETTCRSLCLSNSTCQGINFLEKRGVCVLVDLTLPGANRTAPGWIHEKYQCLSSAFKNNNISYY